MAKAKIPRFRSAREEAEWWDTHDVTEIEGLEVVPEEIFVKPKKQIVSVRLERQLVDLLKRIAREKGLGHTTLVRLWVIEKLREHQKTNA
ncbi:MAG: BrnA antitoxin family protein [Candidatus Bipolaricaulota bacterium]|nr:BrnA antitoxin family protein [Candidatus Bipolaricaulota bacterium]